MHRTEAINLRIHFRRSITVVALLLTFAAFAQVRGKGRLQGFVTDKSTGKPVAGATVTISNGGTKPIVTKTNARGQWSALGFTSGNWSIDIEAENYQTLRGSATISEAQSVPPIRSELEPAEATVPMESEVPNVPDDVVEAVNQAQELLNTEATPEEAKANAMKAAELLEGALPQLPSDTDERKRIRSQVQQVLAQAQYKAGQLDKAIATLEALVAAEPANHGNALLLVNLYLEADKLDEGRALLAKLPDSAVTHPTVYINIGILFLNKHNAADAVRYLDKALALDDADAATYYYRGLANVELQKLEHAKVDFQKVLELAPDGAEAKDARELLAKLR